MTSSNGSFKHESLEDPESIVRYFSALGTGFETGVLMFRADKRQLVLRPQGLINLVVEAKRKGDEIKLTLKLSWNEGPEDKEQKTKPLSIKALKKS